MSVRVDTTIGAVVPTLPPAWAGGAPPTGRLRHSAGSRSSSSRLRLAARSARPRSTTTSQGRESGRMDRILDAGFEQPAGENVLVQSRTLRTTDPAFGCGHGRRGETLEAGCRSERSVAARFAQHGPDRPERARGPRRVRDPRRPRQGRRQDQAGARHGRRAAGGSSAVFVGEFGDASKIDAVVTAYADDLGRPACSPCRSR